MKLSDMRLSYSQGGLHKNDVVDDPMVQFQKWLDEALVAELPDWFEVNAMTLSTSNGSNHVASRIVLLKGLDDGKFWFFTNYDSDKGQHMEANPSVSLCFHWPHLQRQVRAEGVVQKAPREVSQSYFHSRPRESQLGAVASKQSVVVEGRDVLENAMNVAAKKYADQEIPCPDNWGGFAVNPSVVEFWQGRTGRLHDRIRYRRQVDDWLIERLSP